MAGAVNNSFVQVMGSVLSRAGTGSPQVKESRSSCQVCLPLPKPLAEPVDQMFPQSVTPTRSWVWFGGRVRDMSTPPSRAAVWTWRCGDRSAFARSFFAGRRQLPLVVLAAQPTRCRTHRRPGSGAVLLLAAKFKSSGSPCRPINRRRSGMASTTTPGMLSMLGSTPAGPGQVIDQRRMP